MDENLVGDINIDVQKFPRVARLYAYWENLARPQSWADVDLMDMHEIAPILFVADVLDDGASLSFRYRFIGTKIVEIFNLDATGKTVEEAFEGERRELIIEAYSNVVNSKSPHLGIRSQANRDRGHVRMAVLTLPLFDPSGDVNMLLGINDFSVMNADERRDFQGRV